MSEEDKLAYEAAEEVLAEVRQKHKDLGNKAFIAWLMEKFIKPEVRKPIPEHEEVWYTG